MTKKQEWGVALLVLGAFLVAWALSSWTPRQGLYDDRHGWFAVGVAVIVAGHFLRKTVP